MVKIMLKTKNMKPFYDIEESSSQEVKQLLCAIKEKRLVLSLTKKDLSDISGVSVNYIRLIEEGKSIPTILCYTKLMQALKIYSEIR